MVPSPIRQRRTEEEEEGNSKMDGNNCLSVKPRTRPFSDRKCKEKMIETTKASIPDDIVFDILVLVPAQDIHKRARLVCRKWYQMIKTHNFIYQNLHHSTCGLVTQDLGRKRKCPTFVAMRKGRIEVSELSYEFRGAIWSSCNGLMLELDRMNSRVLCIRNPTTKQRFALPPFSVSAVPQHYSAIAYAAASMEYKVVCTSYSENADPNSREYGAIILTVGVDNSWRHVQTKHLSPIAVDLLGERGILITEGYVHWANKSTCILTLNVETEIIEHMDAPHCDGKILECFYLSGGRYLSLLIQRTEFSWDVLQLNPETREWKKLPSIDLEDRKCTFEWLCCKHDSSFKPVGSFNCKLVPAGWLIYPEVLVFKAYKALGFYNCSWTRLCFAYNFCTQGIDLFEIDCNWNNFIVHRNSLVRFDG